MKATTDPVFAGSDVLFQITCRSSGGDAQDSNPVPRLIVGDRAIPITRTGVGTYRAVYRTSVAGALAWTVTCETDLRTVSGGTIIVR